MGKDGRLTKEELLNRYPPPSEMLDKLFTGLIGALANPAYKYTTGDTPDYRDVLSALTGEEKRDWSDVTKDVFPKIQKKLPENVHLNPRMAGTWGGVLNMLLDPTNLVPGAAMAGEIKNVYHGSPHLFDKFSLSKVGTGEGAQAFGYGHYLTSDKNIARHYSGTDKAYKIDGLTAREWYDKHPLRGINNVIDAAKHLNTDVVSARKWMDSNQDLVELRVADAINTYGDNAEYMLRSHKDYDAVKKLDEMRAKNRVQESGHIYEATIAKGRPHNMLQWDKPLSEQPKTVIERLNSDPRLDELFNSPRRRENKVGIASIAPWETKDPYTGKDFYKNLVDIMGSQEKASAYLKRLGIDGIEYPSGTLSGIKDSPHKNYVVFDDADITIEKRTPR